MTPAVVGETVFVGSCSGRFYAFDRESGDVRWTYETEQDGPPANFHGDALVAGDLLVVGSDVARRRGDEEGHVYAFEHGTGAVRWKHAATGGVVSDVLRSGEGVYGVTQEGALLCLGLADGRLRWRVGAPAGVEGGSLKVSAVLAGARIVFSSPGGAVTAVDADSGARLWTLALGEEVNTALAVAADGLFVGTLLGELYRLDVATGEIDTAYPTDGVPYGMPVAVDDGLLLFHGGQHLSWIDAGLREARWTVTIEGEWSAFRPRVLGDEVLAGNDRREVVSIDLGSGRVKGKLPVGGTVRGFVVAGQLLHVGTLEGKFLTYRRRESP